MNMKIRLNQLYFSHLCSIYVTPCKGMSSVANLPTSIFAYPDIIGHFRDTINTRVIIVRSNQLQVNKDGVETGKAGWVRKFNHILL